MGCLHGASFAGEVTDALGPVVIEFCFNDQCESGSGYLGPNNCANFGTTEPADVICCFQYKTPAGTWVVSGDASLGTPKPHQGDRYRLRVKDQQTGALLGSGDAEVQYDNYYPNGPECGPECKRATFGVAPP